MTISEEILLAGVHINKGELVAFPTETVYGLGADAFNPIAVSKIFEIKERPSFDPLIVHISKLSQLDMLCKHVDETMLKLADKFWPGPLTLVVEKSQLVPDIVTSGLNTVGVRMPAHPVAIDLLNAAGTPIAAPSANKFGMISPTESWHVLKYFPTVDYVLEGGKAAVGIESTVIRLIDNGFIMLRPGAITISDLEIVLPQIAFHNFKEDKLSPGLLKSHYSPQKPIYIRGDNYISDDFSKAGLISFGLPVDGARFKQFEVLSETKNLHEAAINLFSAMHNMEKADVEYIIVDPVPEEGIGIAIMDRLKKAVYKYESNTK